MQLIFSQTIYRLITSIETTTWTTTNQTIYKVYDITQESMDMSPGDIYVHLPSTMYGFESWDEPLLTLWAERVVDVDQVPRVIRDVQEVRADLVTSTLTLRFDKGEVAESLQTLFLG